jgi:hypothetical protein
MDEDILSLNELLEYADSDTKSFARSKDLAIDITLTNMVRAYKFEEQKFGGDIIAPPRTVRSKSGKWKTRGKEALNIYVSDIAGDKSQTNEIGWTVGETTYYIDTRRLRILVTDDEIAERGPVIPATEATILLLHAIKLRQEIRIRNLAEATTNSAAAGAVWPTGATVHTDVTAAKIAFRNACGLPATHVVLREDVADEMVTNSNAAVARGWAPAMLRDVFETSSNGQRILGQKPWGLKPVLVNTMYNNAAPEAAATPTDVWINSTFLVRIDPSNRTSTWAVQPQLLAPTIVRWRNDDPGGWYYKCLMKRDEVEVTSEAIYEITGVT